MAKPIFPKEKREYKSEWIDNTDETIKKRVQWMMKQGWFVIALEVSSSSPGKMHIKFGRDINGSTKK